MEEQKPIAPLFKPPYHAVIFTSLRGSVDDEGYAEAASLMMKMVAEQEGFLGVDSARSNDRIGITVSYWRDLKSIQNWYNVPEHKEVQKAGKQTWYNMYSVRVCKVEREYEFG